MRPRFNMLRAAFWLLAFVVVSQVMTITVGGWTCFYLYIVGKAEIGACGGFGQQAREMWAEVLAAIFALIVAGRSGPSDPPIIPPRDEPTQPPPPSSPPP